MVLELSLEIIEKFSELNRFDFEVVGLLLFLLFVRSEEESFIEGIKVEVDDDA